MEDGWIVDTAKEHGYKQCMKEIEALTAQYSFLRKYSIGKSIFGKELPVLRLGAGEHRVLFVGAHHGLERITAAMLLRYVEEYCRAYEEQGELGCCSSSYLFQTRSIYVLPLLNPDGVELAMDGTEEHAAWQSNGRGVDLNHNYNAGWQEYKRLERRAGILGPGPTRYSGARPESEPEVSALCAFCRRIPFRTAVALHTQGEEIYYDFQRETPKNSLAMAAVFSKVSGYQIAQPEEMASFGGFKDWFIHEFGRPAFTIEAGRGKNPLSPDSFNAFYPACREILFAAPLV